MKQFLVAASLVVAFAISAVPVDAADEHASCMGLGISDHAKAGEMPGTVKEVKGFLRENDVSLGAFASEFARVHAGTHDPGCEAAAEEILEDQVGG